MQAPKGWATKGIWVHFPQEKFEILMLWNTISSVLRARGQLLSMNWSLNLFPFYAYFYLRGFAYKNLVLCCLFGSFLDISFSEIYSVSSVTISIIRIHLKISEHYVKKSGFFLSWSQIGQGFRISFEARSGESRRNRDGWTVGQ